MYLCWIFYLNPFSLCVSVALLSGSPGELGLFTWCMYLISGCMLLHQMSIYLVATLINHRGYIHFFTKVSKSSEIILAFITFFHVLNYFLRILAKNWASKIKELLTTFDINYFSSDLVNIIVTGWGCCFHHTLIGFAFQDIQNLCTIHLSLIHSSKDTKTLKEEQSCGVWCWP